MQPIWDKKIMQPLGAKTNHTTSLDKKCPKNSNLSDKKNPEDRHRSPWSCSQMFQITYFFFKPDGAPLTVDPPCAYPKASPLSKRKEITFDM